MPVYNFKVASEPSFDEVELVDLPTARSVAVTFAAAMLRDKAASFWKERSWQLDVADVEGVVLFSLEVNAIDAPALTRKIDILQGH